MFPQLDKLTSYSNNNRENFRFSSRRENKRSFFEGVLSIDNEQLPNRVIVIIFIDMKAFCASVSSVIKGLNPLQTKLVVVGDIKRAESVVLAATPLLKKERVKTGSSLFDILKRKDIYVVNLPPMER